MIVSINDKKPLLTMLLHRWEILAPFAAAQELSKRATDLRSVPVIGQFLAQLTAESMPNEQIQIIKSRIIDLLPEAKFIEPPLECPQLNPDDFTEICVKHHEMCIQKVRELIHKLKIK